MIKSLFNPHDASILAGNTSLLALAEYAWSAQARGQTRQPAQTAPYIPMMGPDSIHASPPIAVVQMPFWQPFAVTSGFAFLYETGTGALMNIRRLLQPMGFRFFLLIIVMFQLFQLTRYLPPSMYWPSHVLALLIGLLFWRLMLRIAKTDQ